MDTVFKVVGYEVKTPDDNFLKSCVFWIFATTAEEAIEKAKTYQVNKPYYEVLEVIEKKDAIT